MLAMGCAAIGLLIAAPRLKADQVEMQNGDHYVGHVLSLDTNTLVLRSDLLGTVHLPRRKVALVVFGAHPATNAAVRSSAALNPQLNPPSAALTNGTVDLSAALRQLGANTNFIQQVQAQFLTGAGPEANGKFNEMVGGLLSGKLTVNDIRAEAKTATEQLKELKRDLGGDDTGALDGYLAILESFLQETEPPAVPATTTNATRLSSKGKAAPGQKSE